MTPFFSNFTSIAFVRLLTSSKLFLSGIEPFHKIGASYLPSLYFNLSFRILSANFSSSVGRYFSFAGCRIPRLSKRHKLVTSSNLGSKSSVQHVSRDAFSLLILGVTGPMQHHPNGVNFATGACLSPLISFMFL